MWVRRSASSISRSAACEVPALGERRGEHHVGRPEREPPAVAGALDRRAGGLGRRRQPPAAEHGEALEVRGGGEGERGAPRARVVHRRGQRHLRHLEVLRQRQRRGGEVVDDPLGAVVLEQSPAGKRRGGELADLLVRVAAQRPVQGQLRQQRTACGGVAALRRHQPGSGGLARAAALEPRGGDARRAEQATRVSLGVLGVAKPEVERRLGLGQPPEREQDAPGLEGRAGAVARRRELLDRLGQAAERLGGPGHRLRAPELQEHVGALVPRRRLLPRPFEQLDRTLRRAGRERPRRGRSQHGRDPVAAAVAGQQQVAGHDLGSRVVVHERTRGREVGLRALACGERLVHRRLEHRLRERQPLVGREQPDGREGVEQLGGTLALQPGQNRRMAELGSRAEHGRRLEQRGGAGVDRACAPHDGGGHRLRGRPANPLDRGRRRRDPGGCQLARELAHEPGHAAGRLVHGRAERGIRIREEGGPEPGGRAALAERRHPVAPRGRMRQHLLQEVGGHAHHGRSEAEHQDDGQRLETAHEVEEELEGGRVGHVHVVDREHERSVGGQVRGEPIEAVHERSRGLGLTCRRPRVEQRQRGARRPLDETLALGAAGGGHARLEQLQRDTQLELPLELPPLGGQQLVPALAREQGRSLEDGALPAAVGALQGHNRPVPGVQPVQGARHQGERVPPLEEQAVGGCGFVSGRCAALPSPLRATSAVPA